MAGKNAQFDKSGGTGPAQGLDIGANRSGARILLAAPTDGGDDRAISRDASNLSIEGHAILHGTERADLQQLLGGGGAGPQDRDVEARYTCQTTDHIAVTADRNRPVVSRAGGLGEDCGGAVKPLYANHAAEIRARGRLGLADDHRGIVGNPGGREMEVTRGRHQAGGTSRGEDPSLAYRQIVDQLVVKPDDRRSVSGDIHEFHGIAVAVRSVLGRIRTPGNLL